MNTSFNWGANKTVISILSVAEKNWDQLYFHYNSLRFVGKDFSKKWK